MTSRLSKLNPISLKSAFLAFSSLALCQQAHAVVANNDISTTSEQQAVSVVVFNNDYYTTNLDVPLTDTFEGEEQNYICLANQFDSQCSLDEVAVNLEAPEFGTVAVNLDGISITYTPDEGFVGTDSFTYAAYVPSQSNTEEGPIAVATVSVTVTASSNEQSPGSSQEFEDALNSLCDSARETEPVFESEIGVSFTNIGQSLDVVDACNTLDALSAEERTEAISTLAADQVTAEHTSTMNISRVQAANLSGRFAQLRENNQLINLNGITLNSDGQKLHGKWLHAIYDSFGQDIPLGQTVQTGGAAGDSQAAQYSSPIGIFISGSISVGDKDSTSKERGFDLDSNNITAGFDYRFDDMFVGGLAYGYSESEIEFETANDNMENEINHVFLYGSWTSDHLFLDGTLGYGFGDIETERRIFIPGSVDTVAQGSTDTTQYVFHLSGGMTFNQGAFSLSPFIKVDLVDGEIEGYQETNGGGFDVAFDKQDIQSQLLTVGAETQYSLSYDWGVLLPSLRFELKNEFEDKRDAITGRFYLDPNSTDFSIATNSIDTFWMQTGVGLTVILPNGFSAFADYEMVEGLNNLSLSTYSLGGRWEIDF